MGVSLIFSVGVIFSQLDHYKLSTSVRQIGIAFCFKMIRYFSAFVKFFDIVTFAGDKKIT